MHLTELCPIGMIFVRSEGGISHNPAEYSSKEDCAAGAAVLYRTLLGLAGEI
jgi:allantoate deiminase